MTAATMCLTLALFPCYAHEKFATLGRCHLRDPSRHESVLGKAILRSDLVKPCLNPCQETATNCTWGSSWL